MTPEDKNYFEELLIKANQSGKRETSALVDDILHRIEPQIKNAIKEELPPAIKENVNGKIDKLNEMVEKQQEDFREHKVIVYEHFKEEKEWRGDVTPILENSKKQQNFFSFGGTILKAIILIGACGTAVVGALHFIKEWINN